MTRVAARVGSGPGGSIRSTGPCGELSDNSTVSRISSRVTVAPRRKVPARPRPWNTQVSVLQVSWACWRDTVGSPMTTSLSGLRPIRTVLPGSKL
jgi:hypothetical protein